MTFGQRVRVKLAELGWTEKRLAQVLGVSRSRVTQILKTDSPFTITAQKVANALGVNPSYFYRDEDERRLP